MKNCGYELDESQWGTFQMNNNHDFSFWIIVSESFKELSRGWLLDHYSVCDL